MLYPNFLALAQLWHIPEYRAAVKLKVQMGCYVILDNGAHEEADFDIGDFIDIVDELRPPEVVMMDKGGEPSDVSFDMSVECLTKMRERIRDYHPRIMICPQGKDADDVVRGYEHTYNYFQEEYHTIIVGVGMGYMQFAANEEELHQENTRLRLMDELVKLPVWHNYEHHILGARWDSGRSKEWYAQYPDVIRSVDTVKPCTCALHRMSYPHKPSPSRIDLGGLSTDIDQFLWFNNINRFCKSYGIDHPECPEQLEVCLNQLQKWLGF
jgi:hypothetical protein